MVCYFIFGFDVLIVRDGWWIEYLMLMKCVVV